MLLSRRSFFHPTIYIRLLFLVILFIISARFFRSNIPNPTSSPQMLVTPKPQQPKSSNFPYKYLMKPGILFTNVGGTERYTIVYVRSAPSEFNRRNVTRHILSQLNHESKLKVALVFVLGITHNSLLNEQIWEEGRVNNDTIVADHFDAYQNLTIKMWSLFHFHLFHLPKSYQPDYVFWTNTDVMINWDNFFDLLQNAPSRNWFAGLLVDPRINIAKQFQLKRHYELSSSQKTSPMYFDGGGVFASNDVFLQLAHGITIECERTPVWLLRNIRLDDMLVTGLWRERLNISLRGCAPYCCNYAACQQYTNVCQRWMQSVFYHPRFRLVKGRFDANISHCNATELVVLHNAELVHKRFLGLRSYTFMDAWNGTLFVWNKKTQRYKVITHIIIK